MLSWQFVFAVVFFALCFAVLLPVTKSREQRLKRGETVTPLPIGKFRLEKDVLHQRTCEVRVVEMCEEEPGPALLPPPREESHV